MLSIREFLQKNCGFKHDIIENTVAALQESGIEDLDYLVDCDSEML